MLTRACGLAAALVLTAAHAAPSDEATQAARPGLIGSAVASTANVANSVVASTTNVANSVVASTTNVANSVVAKAGDLVLNALSLIGVRYRFGGNSPDSGLDCSGFVRYVFNDTLGFLLPRRSAEMSKIGETVRYDELKPGDLVFFNTMRHAFSHVGIYIGDNKFVHAPSRGQEIRIDDMKQAYWSQRYNGARRIDAIYGAGDVPRLDEILDQMKRDGRL